MECGVPVKTDVLVLEASTLPRGCLKMLSPGPMATESVAHKVPRSMFRYTHWKEVEFHSGRDLTQSTRTEARHIFRKLSGC